MSRDKRFVIYEKSWYQTRVDDVQDYLIEMVVHLFDAKGSFFNFKEHSTTSFTQKRYCFTLAMRIAMFDQKRGLLALRPRSLQELEEQKIKRMDPHSYLRTPDEWFLGSLLTNDTVVLFSIDNKSKDIPLKLTNLSNCFSPDISKPLGYIRKSELLALTGETTWVELY